MTSRALMGARQMEQGSAGALGVAGARFFAGFCGVAGAARPFFDFFPAKRDTFFGAAGGIGGASRGRPAKTALILAFMGLISAPLSSSAALQYATAASDLVVRAYPVRIPVRRIRDARHRRAPPALQAGTRPAVAFNVRRGVGEALDFEVGAAGHSFFFFTRLRCLCELTFSASRRIYIYMPGSGLAVSGLVRNFAMDAWQSMYVGAAVQNPK